MTEILDEQERQRALEMLSGWRLCEGRDAIEKSFKFKSFAAAFGWMVQVAMKAEKMDHHPEWLNVYNRVDVTLTTHSANGVTQLDIDLARHMDVLADLT